MKLQENIQRIKEVMGLITENIDDILDKMNRGEELSYEDRKKMGEYTKHIQSGGEDSSFQFNRPSEVDIVEPNSFEHKIASQILLYHSKSNLNNTNNILKKIGLMLKRANIDCSVGMYYVPFPFGVIQYFVKVDNSLVDKAMNVLESDESLSVSENPDYGQKEVASQEFIEKGKTLSKVVPDIIISDDSEVYKKYNLTREQLGERLSKLVRKFGLSNFTIINNNGIIVSPSRHAFQEEDKSMVDELIDYLNSKGYKASRPNN